MPKSGDTPDAIRADLDALVVTRGYMPTDDSPRRVASDRPAPSRSVDQIGISDVVNYPDAAGVVDAPHHGARCVDIETPLVRHGDAPISLAKTGEQMPPAAVFDLPETGDLKAARTIYLRRHLEAAAEHGADLLAALGLPRIVGPDFIRHDTVAVADALDVAIAALDALDGDTDLEPYLAGYYNGAADPTGEGEPSEEDEDDGTSEPSLGAPERHPTVPWAGHWCSLYVSHGPQDRQTNWADGGRHDCEAEITDEPHDGDGEDLEAEPAEDSIGSASGDGDQRHWAQGQAGEREADPADAVELRRSVADWEATFARRDGLRDLARRAEALRQRASRQFGDLKRPGPDTLIPLAPGVMWWAGPML